LHASEESRRVLDLHEIQELVDLVKEANLRELEIERRNVRLKIVNQVTARKSGHGTGQSDDDLMITSCNGGREEGSEGDENVYYVIKSPIVGTFYSAPSPESPDFVAEDVPVDVDSTVCIIEAMKVMNEIQAEVRGIIAKVLVHNGQAVEFGQPLFKVKRT
jgi:acetyl-CoA carboxylase biotin carboxyl carrier protein